MILRPSAAYRWSNCAAYPSLAAQVPQPVESDAAREGTCAAWVAECVLHGDAASCFDLVGRTHQNGWFVTEEMAADVEEYVDLVRADSHDGKLWAEQRVRFSDQPLIEGTLDAAGIVETLRLKLKDLKYGYRLVEVYANPQLIVYGWALYNMLVKSGHQINEIELAIYQPRAFHPEGPFRKWVVTPQELYEHAAALYERALKTTVPDAPATPGAWCSDCPAANGCKALADRVYALTETVATRAHRSLTSVELGRELDFIDQAEKLLKVRATAIRTEAEQRLKSGESVPGWWMTARRGNRRFKVDGTIVQLLTGVDPWVRKECTPKELERRGASPEIVEKLVERPDIGMKLTARTDRDVANVFRRRD